MAPSLNSCDVLFAVSGACCSHSVKAMQTAVTALMLDNAAVQIERAVSSLNSGAFGTEDS